MSNFFGFNDKNFGDDDNDDNKMVDKISLDHLYDRKHAIEQQRIKVFNNILSRIHSKIKLTARQRHDQQFLFYVVPEFIMGVPRYDVATCISYVIDKLTDNGFVTKYTHPNLLFISWQHYIPSYEREKIKKQTGMNVDGFGNVIKERRRFDMGLGNKKKSVNDILLGAANSQKGNHSNGDNKPKKDYKDISQYKPSGIYDQSILDKLKDKLG